MHHELTDYIFANIDSSDWHGSDDYGFSFALVDIDTYIWPVDDTSPESLLNASQPHVKRVLADHCDGSRYVILHWSHTGARSIFGMASHRHASEAFETLLTDWIGWDAQDELA